VVRIYPPPVLLPEGHLRRGHVTVFAWWERSAVRFIFTEIGGAGCVGTAYGFFVFGLFLLSSLLTLAIT
jgi:hypothetical protein